MQHHVSQLFGLNATEMKWKQHTWWNGNEYVCYQDQDHRSVSDSDRRYQDWWLWLEWFPPVADAYCITYSFSGGSFSMDLENRNENLLSVLFLLFMQLNDISLFFSP